MFAPLEHWHEFYLLLGTAAAALVALQFVAASVGAGFLKFETATATRTYMTPVIVHLSSVLLASALALVPWHNATTCAVVFGIASAIGTLYAGVLALRILTDSADHIEFDDRLCHGVAPPIAYAAGIAAAVMFRLGTGHAAEVLAAGLLLLLGVNIRNAWDSTLFLVRKHTEAHTSHTP